MPSHEPAFLINQHGLPEPGSEAPPCPTARLMTRTRTYRLAWKDPQVLAAQIQQVVGEWEENGYAIMSSALTLLPPEDVEGTGTPPQAIWSFGVGWIEMLEESA